MHTRDVWRVVVRSAVVGTQHIKIASNAIQYVEGCPSDGSQCPNNRQPDRQPSKTRNTPTYTTWVELTWLHYIGLHRMHCSGLVDS